ncbi:hypothetical protein HYZ05_01650 [Candidatus Daviesbacteria bacterium]|nr:hypothetical protein [Candidatus Daviesbacteria bacterium]
MQKGQALVYILVGVLIIGVVAGGAYYLGRQTTTKPTPAPVVTSQTPQPTPSPSPDETANWKTYTSNKFSFSIKYPNYINPTENQGSSPEIFIGGVSFEFNKENCNPHFCEGVYIDVIKIPAGLTVQEALKDGYGGTFALTGKENDARNVMVEGLQGISATHEFSIDSKTYDVAIVRGDKMYTFTLFSLNKNTTRYEKLFDLMFSTFKFTN